jgi:hypothetical protein
MLTRRTLLALLGVSLIDAGCAHPHSEATDSRPASPTRAGAGDSLPSGGGPPTFVSGGTNSYLTRGILEANSEEYGGSWSGGWSFDDASASGVMTADVSFDVQARRVTARCAIEGPLLPVPVAPFDIDFDVDSFIFDGDTKTFTARYDSPVGRATVQDNGGGGRFKVTVDNLVGQPDIGTVTANGSALHPSLIPVAFQIRRTDGTIQKGTIAFRMT